MAETVWHEATEFEIEGRGWADTASPYDRFPARAKGIVPQHVWGLSRHSAGLCVRFQTDAPKIEVRWSLISDSLAMPHMPATGVSGVDLYARQPDRTWRYVQTGVPSAQDGNTTEALTGADAGLREYLLYLPLYNGAKRVEIGVPSGSRVESSAPRPAATARPIVVYGTSIVQGGCASRPGLAWTSILGRKLDRPVINLGFSGSGRMEPEVVGVIAELDPAVFVIDALWNLNGEEEAEVTKRVKALVRVLRGAHPQTPILLVGQSLIYTERHPMPMTRWQEKAVRDLRREGLTGLHTASGANLMGKDTEGTVDGVHPNDIGMMRQADALAPVLRRLVR